MEQLLGSFSINYSVQDKRESAEFYLFHSSEELFFFSDIRAWQKKKEKKQIGQSRATLNFQVKVFHFNLTELQSKIT